MSTAPPPRDDDNFWAVLAVCTALALLAVLAWAALVEQAYSGIVIF